MKTNNKTILLEENKGTFRLPSKHVDMKLDDYKKRIVFLYLFMFLLCLFWFGVGYFIGVQT